MDTADPTVVERPDYSALLTELFRANEIDQFQLMMADLHPAEIAHFIEALHPHDRQRAWQLLADQRHGDVLVELSDPVRESLIERMGAEELSASTQGLEADDMADLVGDLPQSRAQQLLGSLAQQDRQRLENILSYEEDTAGGLMNPDLLTIRADITLEVVVRYLRQRGSMPTGTDQLAVVNRENVFRGVLYVTDLLTLPVETLVGEVMDSDGVVQILDTTPDREVAKLFTDRDLISAPVVDSNNRLLGRITIDDVVDVMREDADESFLGMAGVQKDEDMFAPVLRSARRRNIWLGVNLVTAFAASFVIGLFDRALEELVALAILMPIVASMGGNAGNQTLALIIRGIALEQINRHNARSLLRKELRVGLINGIVWASVVSLLSTLWFGNPGLGAVIGAAMIINMMLAAAAGFLVPMTLKRLNIDPAIASTVLLTSITDIMGFFVFLGLATLYLI
ncbi:MAG: magnesium transporter [Immundisolibacteraceae bacterium]|nr:magnesium transporter [Immundisolibacteraceae bacterium]